MTIEVKVLCQSITNPRGRYDTTEVSREEWDAWMQKFPDKHRYTLANLAAHHWTVIAVGERLGVVSAFQDGMWLSKDGTTEAVTPEEKDRLYPQVGDELRYTWGYITVWEDGKQIIRDVRVHIESFASAATVTEI